MLLNDKFLIAMGILGIFAIVAIVFLWFKSYGIKDLRKNTRESIFYIKWFFIGRYHCNVSSKTKKFLQGLNKLFWGVVIISIALLLADIIEFFCRNV